jgi:hypothetical protein
MSNRRPQSQTTAFEQRLTRGAWSTNVDRPADPEPHTPWHLRSNSTTRAVRAIRERFRSYINRRRDENLTVGASVALSYVIHIRDGRTEATSPSIQAPWMDPYSSLREPFSSIPCMHQ